MVKSTNVFWQIYLLLTCDTISLKAGLHDHIHVKFASHFYVTIEFFYYVKGLHNLLEVMLSN